MLNQLGLGFVFTAKDLASGVIQRLDHNFGGLAHQSEQLARSSKASFAELGQGMAIFAAGTALIGGAFALAEQGSHFVDRIGEAGALAHASAAEMERLRAAAVASALQGVGNSAADAAEGLRELMQEGYGVDDAIKALDPTLTLVGISLGQISRSQAAALVVDTLKEFRLGAASAAPLVDKLALTMRTFGIRASELEPALRGVASGASLSGAGLDDTLIALGLTKSVLPSVEQAARSLNMTFNQLASSHTRQELAAIGVQVTDSAGKMRPLLEILVDLNTRTSHMSEAQRENALASIFSARAGGGLTAIMQALSEGIRDSTGHVVTGTQAIEQLRKQMEGAAGTASEMRDAMLDTFEGQQKAMIAAVDTILQLAGEPFKAVFKDIFSVMRRAFVAVGQFIDSIPMPVKIFLARVVLVVGAVVALVGAIVAAKAAIALVATGLSAVGITFGGIVAALLPLVALVGVLALAVTGFVIAYQHDIGGIASFVEGIVARVKLAYQGLVQVFTQGGFSGAVMSEIDKAENAGIKQFAIRVYMIGYRIQRFFAGIAEGFQTAIAAAGPVFESFVAALRELGEAFGIVGSQAGDALALVASDRYAVAGQKLGDVLARIVTWIVNALTVVIRVGAGIINGVREAIAYFRPVFELVGHAIGFLAEEFQGLVADISGVSERARQGGSAWSDLGEILGETAGTFVSVLAGAIGVVALALRTAIVIVRNVISGFEWLGTTIGETAAKLYLFFTEDIPRALKPVAGVVRAALGPVLSFIESVFDHLRGAIDHMLSFLGGVVAKVPDRFRPSFLDSIVEAGQAADARIAARATRLSMPVSALAPAANAAATAVGAAGVTGPFWSNLAAASAVGALPAAAEVRARAQLADDDLDAVVARLTAASDSRPVQAHVTLQVDGETLARATARADRSFAARSFVPVGTGAR